MSQKVPTLSCELREKITGLAGEDSAVTPNWGGVLAGLGMVAPYEVYERMIPKDPITDVLSPGSVEDMPTRR